MEVSYLVKLSNSSIYRKPVSIKIFVVHTSYNILSQKAHQYEFFFLLHIAGDRITKKSSSHSFSQNIEVQSLYELAPALEYMVP